LLKKLLAAGYPVMIEETFRFESGYWPKDDLWGAHYQLLTGYNESTKQFIGQDSFYGSNLQLPFDILDDNWHAFNNVYIILYPLEQEGVIKEILGSDWDVDTNRQHALEWAQQKAEQHPQDAFYWFDVGTNLVYFERYNEATHAYDTARNIGLPQRMLRYQFGPFIAYFHASRIDDLLSLTDYALKRTPNSEEALLWKGWGLFRKGEIKGARTSFQQALDARSGYEDALYALNYLDSQQK
jgi:tetratricopeptide (TPR) repeat protein